MVEKKVCPKSVKNIIKTLPGVQKGVSDTFWSILGEFFFLNFQLVSDFWRPGPKKCQKMKKISPL